MTRIARNRIAALRAEEAQRFVALHPRSVALAEPTARHFLFGVPMHWMNDWSPPTPLFAACAQGARFTCADGIEHADFCLGDTGAMFGHSPPPVAAALARQAARGYTTMLPSEDAAAVGELLTERFGLPFWQLALTATDANRFVLRWARAVTGRKQIVVFNGCYHGTVDDVFVDLVDGKPAQRDSLLGQAHDLRQFTRVVEFNDIAALEAALADGQVACVITEPALTNIGMVLPAPGFLDAVRELTQRHGSLLVFDETHTISTGLGGWTRTYGPTPDMLVLGKPVAGGLPCAVYGFNADLAERMRRAKAEAPPGHSGIGTTLSGNMLGIAALRANLAEVMTGDAYATMLPLAERLAAGLREIIARHRLPWCVTRVGARCEFQFCSTAPRNGSEAGAADDHELSQAIHLALLNRGAMITPFHNMMLVCPATTGADIDHLLAAFDAVLDRLTA
ncbi:MAG TPA: aspartate aminotransferase family protein [Rhodocyclaceae bacterium]|nr:aspartate aminotransferase family protein [Rhodocyclaceae bacterium]